MTLGYVMSIQHIIDNLVIVLYVNMEPIIIETSMSWSEFFYLLNTWSMPEVEKDLHG